MVLGHLGTVQQPSIGNEWVFIHCLCLFCFIVFFSSDTEPLCFWKKEKKKDLYCLGPSGRVVQEKKFCLQAAQSMFLLILNILLISARFPLESLDSSFPKKHAARKFWQGSG